MCLSSVEKFRPCRKGYKVMRISSLGLNGQYRGTYHCRKEGVWLKEEDSRINKIISSIHITQLRSYPMGWHIYHYKKDALEHLGVARKNSPECTWVLVEVSVRKPCVAGFQRVAQVITHAVGHRATLRKVTVSKEIRIDRVLES